MADLRVERGSTAKIERVDGELRVGSNAKIMAAKGKQVTVTGAPISRVTLRSTATSIATLSQSTGGSSP